MVSDFREWDDDLRYLRRIRRAVASEHQEALRLLESDPGFVGAKKELVKCDLVIAARMHCTINALAAHVPTILVAYSHKAHGMCRYVYGNDDWVIPLDELAVEHVLETKIRLMLDQELEIRAYLDRRIPEIQQDAYRPMQRLKKVLEEWEATE